MQTAEKISITVTPETLKLVRASVESGEYASTSEVVRDALRLWQREREEHAERIAAIKARIERSVNDPRPRLSIEEVRARFKDRFLELRKLYPDEAL